MSSKHFESRARQRAIPPVVFDWLEAYGEEEYDHHGGIIMFFSKRSKRLLERDLGRHFVQQNHKYLNAYKVTTTDGQLITTGWRTKRVWSH